MTLMASPKLALFGAALPGLLLCGLSVVSLAALGSTIEADLRISHTWLGALQSATFAGNLLGSFLFVHYIRRHPLSTLGLASLAILAVSNLVSSFPALAALLPGRFGMGLANCGLMMFGSTLAIRAWPERQDALLNLVHGTMATGSCIGMFLTLPLARLAGGWGYLPLLVAALLLLPIGMLVVGGRGHGADAAASGTAASVAGLKPLLAAWWRLLRDPAVRRAAPALIGYILAESAVVIFFPLYVQQRCHQSAATAAVMIGLFLGGIVTGRMAAAWHLGGQDATRLTIALMAGGATVLLAALWPGYSTALPATMLLAAGGVIIGPVAPLAVGVAVRRTTAGREDFLALANVLLCVGGLAGGALVGWCSDVLGLGFALVLSLVVFALAALPLASPCRTAPVACNAGTMNHDG